MQFEYRTFIYKTFDKKYDKFSSLERLVLRKIPMMNPTPNLADWDKHTQLYHGVLQLSSLTELDLSENAIHKELQCQLQVRISECLLAKHLIDVLRVHCTLLLCQTANAYIWMHDILLHVHAHGYTVNYLYTCTN